MKYTYDDIITAKDILTGKVKKEDIIGKKGLFLNCIPMDMSLNTLMRIGYQRKLVDVELIEGFCFSCGDDNYLYFLPEKEESAPVKSCEEHKLPDEIHELDISVFSSLETIWEIDRPLCPRIKGYTINDSGEFIAFDNTAGEFFVEDFDTREKAISWLNGTGTKEEMNQPSEPEYVPFDLLLPEDREAIRGKWLKNKNSGSEYQVISIFHNNRGLYSSDWNVQFAKAKARTASQLLDHYEFLDGTPCGKQIKQIIAL